MDGLERWRAFVESRDPAVLWEALAPEAVFESPVAHTPQRGREITFKYLIGAMHVLGGEGFRYLGEWRSDDGAVLEFEREIDGVRINGVDMISWNGAGQITHFKVMVRPLKAINLLHQLMAAALAKAGG